MVMNAYGIEFAHRRPDQRDFVAKDFAEFTAFAALCDRRGVAVNVHLVFFDTKSQTFNITVAAHHENGPVHAAIAECADQTLPQYVLFGYVGGKNLD
jgi:hypothetical protein